MKNKRREFLKITALTGLGIGSGVWKGFASGLDHPDKLSIMPSTTIPAADSSIIGQYGPWAASLTESKLPSLSFRKKEWKNLETWRTAARKRLTERLAIPDIGGVPGVTRRRSYHSDCSWVNFKNTSSNDPSFDA